MKRTEDEEHAYLWDGSGEPDPDVVRLETLLGQLRHRGMPPAFPGRPPRRLRSTTWVVVGALATAAVLILLANVGWHFMPSFGRAWNVQTITGTPIVDGTRAAAPSAPARLRTGGWVETDAVSRARIGVGDIGRVDVEPNTRVQMVEASGRAHRMSLARGTIHARIWARPKLFFVNTPSATAIDLGCEYTLHVDDGGAGQIRVALGWVSLEGNGRASYIPEGAIGATRPGAGPGTPYYDDAPSGYGEALDLIDFAPGNDPRRADAFNLVISSARRRDAFTLWHLLTRGTLDERGRVYDRLATLVPPPGRATRDAILQGDRQGLDQWWDSLGLGTTTWWKLWKSKL